MRPLTQDDLIPLDEYAGRRREYFESHCRYLDRYRRVRVGPVATLIFENRQTLWFHVQEVLRIARATDVDFVQRELDLFNRLLPAAGQLQAALIIDVKNEFQLTTELEPWANIGDNHIRLCIGKDQCAASLLTCRAEDRCIGAAHWLQFTVDEHARKHLADPRQPAFVEIDLPAYKFQSAPIGEDVRQSLVDDLKSATH